MKMFKTKEEVIETIINEQNVLIVQDLDGVCIPLVQDPLKREINIRKSSKQFSSFSWG